jgi:ATP adenylyltransferase
MNEPEFGLPGDANPDSTSLVSHQRLWTPWRMRYIGGEKREAGCVFCNRFAADDDVRTLILHRGTHAFIIMNLFPYNTGHAMIVPIEHAGSPEVAAPDAMVELSLLQPPLLRALRRALGCDGFNLGMNVGAEAGAGIAEHLHQHVVPRWTGDANFMPILANTMVMPELIPTSYAKIRGELARELFSETEATCVLLAEGDQQVLVDEAGLLPRCAALSHEPIWKAAGHRLRLLTDAEIQLAGWAGEHRATGGPIGLSFRSESSRRAAATLSVGCKFVPVAVALSGPDNVAISNSLDNLVTP